MFGLMPVGHVMHTLSRQNGSAAHGTNTTTLKLCSKRSCICWLTGVVSISAMLIADATFISLIILFSPNPSEHMYLMAVSAFHALGSMPLNASLGCCIVGLHLDHHVAQPKLCQHTSRKHCLGCSGWSPSPKTLPLLSSNSLKPASCSSCQ